MGGLTLTIEYRNIGKPVEAPRWNPVTIPSMFGIRSTHPIDTTISHLSMKPALFSALLGLAASACQAFAASDRAPAAATAASPALAPFVNTWLVCGPFDTPVAAEKSAPKPGESVSGKAWEYFDDRLWNRNYDNYQDLSGYYAVRKGIDTRNKTVYVATCVFSPASQAVEFRFGISGTGRLIVNGSEVQRIGTPKEVQRDMYKQGITLQAGWNRILLEIHHDFTADKNANGAEIAKDAAVSYLGFYGRVSDPAGHEVPGLCYSISGDAPALTIDTRALAALDVVADPAAKGRGLPANVLPIGYVEWPYVWNKSLYPVDNRRIWADAYHFQAGGGTPGYRWAIAAGKLPDGLTLNPDGTIDGFCSKVGVFPFTVQVTDGKGKTTRKELSITVKDRPNRWFEEGRVGALSHCVPVYPFWVDSNFSADLWAERAKRQGHSLVSIESLQQNYYWPSKFEDPKHPRNQYQPRDKDGKVLDGLKPFADAVKRYGMKFGLYYATEGGGLGHFSTDVFVQNCSDLIARYDPAYLYFDGPQSMGGANYDVMYSNVRNYGDDIIINSNVWGGHGEFGDADLGTSEASHIYANADPARHTKRTIVEPWKSIITKNNYSPYYGKRDDFRQVVKEMVMNAARGYVDNNDQMPLMSRGPNWDSPTEIARRYPRSIQEYSDVREGTAGWFAPVGKPERHESTTGTVPYFLSGCGYEDDGKGNIASFAHGKGPAWGYATARDNSIYLHFIKGPDGKKGYTGEKTITIGPVADHVQTVTWLNEDKPLPFTQAGGNLTITLDGIAADPVDTIVKIVTTNPARKYKLTNLVATGRQIRSTSLQVRVEGFMTYPALKVPFAKNGVRFASSNPAVATVDGEGIVTSVSAGKATITAEGASEASIARDTLNVVVDAARNIRVDDALVGVVLRLNGKEAYTRCAGTAPLPFTLEGRSKKGGPISLQTAKITMKSGLVDYAKGTPYQPVFITEKPVGNFQKDTLVPFQASEATRAAVWAEIDLDGVKAVSNKVFLDMEPAVTVTSPATVIAASSHLGACTPDKVNDGLGISRDGSDQSKWSASGKEPSWIAFDLLEAVKVSEVEILFNTLEQAYVNTPEIMEIQASPDGRSGWKTLATATPPPPGQGNYFGFTDTFRFKPVKARYLRLSFPKGNPKGDSVDLLEVKFKGSLINNLAMAAKVTVSSVYAPGYPGENVIDGIIGELGRGEWGSKGEANPWIRLEWEDKTAVRRIVLYDRSNPADHLRQGTLTFSDGSSLDVTEIPNDGSAKVVEFPVKSVQWIKFQGTGNQPGNNGLSEFEVFGPE